MPSKQGIIVKAMEKELKIEVPQWCEIDRSYESDNPN